MFINIPQWGKVAREFSTLLYVSHFLSFICLWILILWKSSIAFEDENKAQCSQGKLQDLLPYMSFMYQAAHPEPPRASGERRNSAGAMVHLLVIIRKAVQLFCLNAKLLGKSQHFGFTQGHCGLLAGILFCLIIFVSQYQSNTIKCSLG